MNVLKFVMNEWLDGMFHISRLKLLTRNRKLLMQCERLDDGGLEYILDRYHPQIESKNLIYNSIMLDDYKLSYII